MFRSLYLIVAVFVLPLNLFADCCGGKPDGAGQAQVINRDFDPLREYVNSKRSIPGVEKIDNLTISGDIRTTWSHLHEKYNCVNLRGNNSPLFPEPGCTGKDVEGIHFPTDAFEVTFNFYVDYVYDRAWAVGWVSYSNRAGLQGSFPCCNQDPQACRGSGTCEGICLRKAYIGYNVCATGDFRLDIEVGRRPLWTVFDSYIQFANRFDGILAFASYNVCGDMDAYIKGGPFVIDERTHHFGYVGEAGLLNIFDSRFDLKYSLISWKKHGKNRCAIENPIGCQYLNSQITAAYWLNSDYLWNKTKLYAAAVINHESHDRVVNVGGNNYINRTGDIVTVPPGGKIPYALKGANVAWYAGFLIGQICFEGDWSLDVNYQYVPYQVIPDNDLSGIGNGGLASCFCFDGFPDFPCPASLELINRSNYHGWHFEGLYAFTDNLIADIILEFSSAINGRLSGSHHFSRFQVQAIYAF